MNWLLNFSGVFGEEGFKPSGSRELDFSKLDGTNCFCSPESLVTLRKALRKVPLGAVHWIDTGDYHYLTKLFLEMVNEPFQLLLFDHHSDRQPSELAPDLLSCGAWVADSLRDCPMLKSVCTVGTCDGSVLKPDLPIYISIDLDVLSADFFRTDWSQGEMTPDELESLLSGLAGNNILGIDVCGGLTVTKGARDEDLALNCSERFRLLERLSALLG